MTGTGGTGLPGRSFPNVKTEIADVKKNPSSPYAKKPGETAADHMKRLRKEFPKKFGKQPGPNKNPTRKFSKADLEAAEKRGAEKAAKELKAAAPAPAPAKPVSETTAAAPAETPATAAPSAPAPAAVSAPAPAPQTVSEADIFSPPPPADQAGPETAGSATAAPPPPQDAGPKADGAKYGAMIWAMIVQLCCSIFGDGFKPVVIKDAAGAVIYDEGAEGIKVWVNYLASIGIKIFSPVVELWIFMASYVGLRAGLIIQKFKRKKAGAQPTGPKEPPPEPAKSEPTEAPKAPPPPSPAAAASGPPASAIGEIETGEAEI